VAQKHSLVAGANVTAPQALGVTVIPWLFNHAKRIASVTKQNVEVGNSIAFDLLESHNEHSLPGFLYLSTGFSQTPGFTVC
jgi:hypothetical protein